MKQCSSCFNLLLLFFLPLSTIGGISEPTSLNVNYYEIVNPGKWYFIPKVLNPPWQLHILNQLVYNESTPHPAKIMMGQSTSKGPIIRLDLGFYRKFTLQVNINPENEDSQINQIPWYPNNETIIVLSDSYLSISDESMKLLKKPINEFRLDFLIFWAANHVLLNGKLHLQWGSHEKYVNPVLALIYNLYDGIQRISIVEFAVFVVILLLIYKGWMFLLQQLEEKR